MVQAQALGLVRIFRIPFSTNVERVALAAGHKGIAGRKIDVDPDDRSVVEQVSGQPLVPVLVHGSEIVSDSPRIVDWLEERVPEPALYPAEPARRAEATVFVQWFNRVWKGPPNALVERDDPELEAEMLAAIGIGEFGVADVIAFPFLKYAVFGLPEGDDELFHRILVDRQPLRRDSPLHAWARRVDAHPRS